MNAWPPGLKLGANIANLFQNIPTQPNNLQANKQWLTLSREVTFLNGRECPSQILRGHRVSKYSLFNRPFKFTNFFFLFRLSSRVSYLVCSLKNSVSSFRFCLRLFPMKYWFSIFLTLASCSDPSTTGGWYIMQINLFPITVISSAFLTLDVINFWEFDRPTSINSIS